MTLKDDARMAGIAPVKAKHIFLITEKGKGMVIETKQVPLLSGTGVGVKLIKLAEGKLAGFKFVGRKDKVTLAMENGKTKEVRIKDVPVYNRGSQGVILSKRSKIVNLL